MKHYSKLYIQHLILQGIKDRELAMLGSNNCNIRALKSKNYFELERALKLANWDINKPNLYRGVATLKNIPNFTFNPKIRSSETMPWFIGDFNKEIKCYDLFFDFDDSYEKEDKTVIKGSWDDVRACVRDLKDYFDEYNIPYSLIFSGNKGFQIIISGELLEIEKIERGNIFPHKTIQENIKKMLDLKFLDLSNNGVNSRLCKVPYSLVLRGEDKKENGGSLVNHPEEKMNIALPLSDEQFENFKIEDMNCYNVFAKVKGIKDRGMLERFSNLSIEKKRENLAEFINMVSFK